MLVTVIPEGHTVLAADKTTMITIEVRNNTAFD
jgi:hypothetical protein